MERPVPAQFPRNDKFRFRFRLLAKRRRSLPASRSLLPGAAGFRVGRSTKCLRYRNSRIRMSATENPLEIDEELYSRQLYVLGHEAMQKMATATVLVSGMTGLGVEIAKNVILAGVKSVTLHDQEDAQWSDLSSQVVVLTNSSLEEQLDISDFCHANQICFVLANTKGLAGQVFCDFGENFVVYDPSKADPAPAAIKHITLGNPGLLTVAQGHFFVDGDWVKFSKIEGMTQLNGSKPRQICVKGKNTLEIGDTSSFSPYQHGGIISRVEMPQKHSYFFVTVMLDLKLKNLRLDGADVPKMSLRACMANPKINTDDTKKKFRYRTLHAAFQALHTFQNKFGRLPSPQNQADADMLVELVRIPVMDQEQENLIRTFAYGCMGDLSPMNSLIGGIAAQEVLKAVSGKFTPLDQWLYFDAYECLPEGEQLTEKNCAPCDSRYDGQIAVFGADFQKRLGKQKYFLVGAGAIGCELLKNFAMIGLAAGEGGEITVTDMDIIEKSNLNRQFLFRPQDVSKPKSEVAAAAIRRMNPNINVIAQQNQVGPDTEHFYGDDFFLGLDGVASALDSFQARNYVGERCVCYLKPLLDSGTDGTMGSALVFVPYLTKKHGHINDGDSGDSPFCTLRHFPSNIEHTIQWARNQFEDLFKRRAEATNKFLRDPTFFEKEDMKILEMLNLVKMSLKEQPHCWEDCVAWARKLWERLFCHDILQLLYNYPPEHVRHPFYSQLLPSFLPSTVQQMKCEWLKIKGGSSFCPSLDRVHTSLAEASNLIKTHSRKGWSHLGGIASSDLPPQIFTLAASLGCKTYLAQFQALISGVSFLELLSCTPCGFLTDPIYLCPQETSSRLPFWSGFRRCPHQLKFDYNNTTHKNFIVIASRLFAKTHRLLVPEDEATTSQVLLELHFPPFHPQKGIHIPATDEEIPTSPRAKNQRMLVELKQELGKLREEFEKDSDLLPGHMEPLHFEKDKDSHLEFITCAANLRAENYDISPVDKFQAKRIVGQIVPAIVTTTAAVAGLTCLELYKLVWQHKDLGSYRHTSLQLSDVFLSRAQPVPSGQAYKYQQKTWNCWDRITVPGFNSKGEVVTLRDICDHIQREHDLVPQRLLYGSATLYVKKDEIEEQQPPFSLTESIRKITGKPVPKECRLLRLEMVCENEEFSDDIPAVHVMLQTNQ
ncbi:hypothetical protein E2320_015234 [Naja naja]|nr:hypothetical protein E2320_015234 [Naja naja]